LAFGVEVADWQVMPASAAARVSKVEETLALWGDPTDEDARSSAEWLMQPLVSLGGAGLHREGGDGRHCLTLGIWLPFGCR
jgi:hypothetical protein